MSTVNNKCAKCSDTGWHRFTCKQHKEKRRCLRICDCDQGDQRRQEIRVIIDRNLKLTYILHDPCDPW